MQKNIDRAAQRKRRIDAVWSVVFVNAFLLFSAVGMLLLRWYYQIDRFWGAVLLILSVLELGMMIPVWILLKVRLKEIEGGEEDAAAQY